MLNVGRESAGEAFRNAKKSPPQRTGEIRPSYFLRFLKCVSVYLVISDRFSSSRDELPLLM